MIFPLFFSWSSSDDQIHWGIAKPAWRRQVLKLLRRLRSTAGKMGRMENPKAFWRGNIPSGKLSHSYGKSPFFYGKTHYKWPFSIAMLNYQRVASSSFRCPWKVHHLVVFTGFSEYFLTSVIDKKRCQDPQKNPRFPWIFPHENGNFSGIPHWNGQPQMRGETEVFRAVSDAQTQQNETHRHPFVVPCVLVWACLTGWS